jgi:uncharacterized protein (TIGR03437 family)
LYRFQFPTLVAAVFAGLLAGTAAPAQTVSVVAGNGQFICPACQNLTGNFQTLKVLVTDANGNPMPNVTVNWATNAASYQAVLASSSTITGADGTTTNALSALIQLGTASSQSYLQYTVTATAGNSTATFYLNQGFDLSISGLILQAANVSFPKLPGNLSGSAGSTASSPVQVLVADRSGQPIPNVSVLLQNQQSGPSMQCKSSPGAGVGAVLTDSTGQATCQPVFGPVAGSGQFLVAVGGAYPGADITQTPTAYRTSGYPISFTTTAAAPGSVTITQGNGQTVNPGQSLPTLMGVQVNDINGNPLAAQNVNWSVSPAGSATLGNTVTTTDTNGRTTNNLTVSGSALGTITVTAAAASDTTKSTRFTISVVQPITITGFTIVSGNNQSAPVSTSFGSPLVVKVTTSTGTGAANVPVQFSGSGPISLSATSVNTDQNGQASVNVTAGSVSGAASVTASIATTTGIGSQTFSLTVLPPAPAISSSNFVNGADPSLNTLSPCSLGALVGSSSVLGVSAPVPGFPGAPINNSTTARITFSNVSAPIFSIANLPNGQQQILFQVPCEVTPGSVPVTVNLGGGTTNLNLTVQAGSPGIYQTVMSDGVTRAVLVRPDGSYVSPTNPARRGETEVAFVTGLGPTSPPIGTAALPAPNSFSNVQATVLAGMNGGGIPVLFARLSEDLPGVYLVAIEIPSDAATGDDTFSVGVVPIGGGATISSNTVKIPVQ